MSILYGSSVLDGTLTTASKMSSTTGGAESTKQTVFVAGTGGVVWGEVWSQGNGSLPGVSSQSTPTGRGWIYFPGVAGSFQVGNWSAVINAQVVQHSAVSSTYFMLRFYKYSGGNYTSIGSINSATKPFSANNTKTQISFTATSMPSISLGASDGIYVDLWWYDNASVVVGDNPTIYESNSGTAGVANYMQITTSAWSTTGVTYSNDVTGVSSSVQQTGIERAITGVSASVQTTSGAGLTRSITTVSTSLQDVTNLTLYGTLLDSPTLATGKQAVTVGGASSAGYDNALGSATGYSELIPEGTTSAWAALGALPGSATGNGYLLDSTILEGRTLQGSYSDTLRARIYGGTGDATADFYTRIYKRSSEGSYTLIGTLSLTGQTVTNGTSANYTLSDVFPTAVSFATGDKLYFERFANVTAGVSGAANMRIASSSSTTLGSDNCALVTPGYYGQGALTPGFDPLVLFFSSANATAIGTANQLYTLAGSPSNANASTTTGTATAFGEVWARGTTGAWAASDSIGSQSGHGFVYETSLAGQTLNAGNYSATVRLQTAGTGAGTVTADIHYRVSVYNGGVYTTLIDLVASSQTITTTANNYRLYGSTSFSTTGVSGDYLYIDVWLKILTNTGASTQTIRVSSLSTDSGGGTGSLNGKCITPGLALGGTRTYNAYGACLFSTGDASSRGNIFGESNFLLSILDSNVSQVRFQIPWESIERPVQSTSQTTIAAGVRTIVIDAPIPANFANGVHVNVGVGSSQEEVTITTWSSPNLTATFAKAHTGPYPVMVIPQDGDTPDSCGSPARVQAYDWTAVDDYVRVCQGFGLYCVFVIQNAPDWHIETLAIDGSNTVAKAADSATFTTALMQRIITIDKAPIQVLEVANEGFNSGLLTSGNAASMFSQMVTLMTSIRTSALAVQDTLVIGAPCALTLNGTNMSAWVNGFFDAGCHLLTDYGAFHFYPPRGPDDPDVGKAGFNALVAIWESAEAARGLTFPVKITEVGWTMSTVGDATYNGYLTTLIADYIAHPLLSALYHYDLDAIVPGTHFNDGSTNTSYVTWKNAVAASPSVTPVSRTITDVSVTTGYVSHTDTFDRTVAGSLGTAPDGHTYTLTGVAGASWSCQSGAYAQLTNTTGWCYAQHGSDASMTDMDITFDFMLNYTGAGPGTCVFFHATNTANGYVAGYQNGTIQIWKWTGGVWSDLGTAVPFGITAGAWYSCHVSTRGNSISLRAWTTGNAEPDEWHVNTSDTSYTSGFFGLAGYAANVTRTMSWDNLVVISASTGSAGGHFVKTLSAITTSLQDAPKPGGTPGVLPGQLWYNGVSNYVFGIHDHSEPGMSVPSPNAAAITMVKNLGMPPGNIMRTFISAAATDTQINNRLNDIARMNGTPLVCLQTPTNATFNTHVVTMLGDRCLMYEFGNEPNATATPLAVGPYSTAWNAQIPNLRHINPKAKFMGPAVTKVGDSYIQTWLDNCKSSGVIPDAVTFHTYPCTGMGSTTQCMTMTGIGAHINTVRGFVTSRFPNRQIPIGLTEWNVDASSPMAGWAHNEPFADQFYLAYLQSLISANTDFACCFSLLGDNNNYDMIDLGNNHAGVFYTSYGNAVGKLYVQPPNSLTGVHTLLNISVATKASSMSRVISGVSVTLTSAPTKVRSIDAPSVALKALGVPRPLSFISAATKQFGITRQAQNVAASVGTIDAPVFSVSISGLSMPVQQSGLSFDRRVDDRAGGSFEILDTSGNGTYEVEEDQQVAISDTGQNLVLYRGFIDSVSEQMINGTTSVRRSVQLKDLRYLAEKKMVKEDFTNWTAGNLAAYLTQSELEEEQIKANYALRRDHDASAWAQGTLSGVTSANGYLELARAGTDMLDADTTTSDFSSGTLTGVTATNNSLRLQSSTALKFSGTAGKNVGVNAGNYYCYYSIWAGTLTINSGDYLEYTLWMSSESADLVGGIDIQFSDRSCLKDTHWPDQYGIDCHPGVHMQGWADDQWLYRKIPFPPNSVGKKTATARIALESDKDGYYCMYVRSCSIKAAGGATRATIFDTTLQRMVRVSNVGYYHLLLRPITVYEERGTRLVPPISLSGTSIAGTSTVAWSAQETAQPSSTGSTNADKQTPQILIETSLDGGDTWQTCENEKAIPGLSVGTDLTNRSLQVRQTLAVGGPNPELTPTLLDSSVAIESAYASNKLDVTRSYSGPEMIDGTNTYCGYQTAINTADGWQRNDVSGLKMDGWRKNWRTGQSPNQPCYGPSVPGAGPYNGAYYIQSGAGTGAHVRLQNAGTYSHASTIMIEADLHIGSANNVGLIYCTNYWGNTDNSFGYYAYISVDTIGFGRGSNANSNAWTSLWTLAASLDAGQWYHLKAVVGPDHIHHIFLDDIEYITWTDATFTSGGVGMRMYSGGTNGQGHFDNFGVANIGLRGDYIPAQATRTAPSVSLNAAGTVAASIIEWNETVPDGCTLDVQTSLDGGSTYTSCTNNAEIPGLSAGTSVSGKSLLVRVLLNSDSISYTPTLQGISWSVIGMFSASGYRISPVLDADNAVSVGSSSVTWDADVPSSGTLGVDSSLDASSWTVLANNGDAVAGLTEQGDVWWDNFDSDSSAHYSHTTGHWQWDVTNSQLVTISTSDTLTLGGVSTRDVEVVLISDRLEGLQILMRNSGTGHYDLQLTDSSGSGGPKIDFEKWTSGGGSTMLHTEHSTPMTRGQYHTLRVILQGEEYTVWLNGVQLYTGSDGSPLAGSGSVGLWFSSGTSHICDLTIRPLGQDATGVNVYSRVRLSSTNALSSPKVRDLVACVRHPNIATGAVIPQTQDWAYKQSVATALDECAKSSNMSWRFNESYQTVMQPRDGQIAAFVLATVNGNIDGVTMPKVVRSSPQYRNRQYITGAVDLIEYTESKLGNGVSISWELTYPVDSLISVEMNGESQSFGVRDTDTGKAFYYKQAENVLSFDTTLAPPTTAFTVTYVARKPYRAMVEDTAQQSILAALEGASGIVEASEDIGGLPKEAADALAVARLVENGRLALQFSIVTLQSGLAPGQLLTVVIPQHSLDDLQFLITSVGTQVREKIDGSLVYWYSIEATTGPSTGSWARSLYARLLGNSVKRFLT